MSEILEQQSEEREALQSIYEGDDAFKEINTTTFQYKVVYANVCACKIIIKENWNILTVW